MKKLKTFGKIAAGLLFVFILYYNFGLLERYNFVTAYWDGWTGSDRIVTYGERHPDDILKSQIAPTLGFDYNIAIGCVVTKPFLNGLSDYNAVMASRIKNRLGKNWEDVLNDAIEKQK
jgi:hypothetical protein